MQDRHFKPGRGEEATSLGNRLRELDAITPSVRPWHENLTQDIVGLPGRNALLLVAKTLLVDSIASRKRGVLETSTRRGRWIQPDVPCLVGPALPDDIIPPAPRAVHENVGTDHAI